MRKEVDARNLACPQPVMLTKKALAEIEQGVVVVLVNSQGAKENVTRYAKSQNCTVEVNQTGDEYIITITKGQSARTSPEKVIPAGSEADSSGRKKVFFITSDSLGRGSDDLGLILMRNLLLTLLDSGEIPAAFLFVNSGVKLCCEGSPALEYLVAFATRGTKVLSCGTCLNYYGLNDKLRAGEVTSMPTIVEYLTGPFQVVSL